VGISYPSDVNASWMGIISPKSLNNKVITLKNEHPKIDQMVYNLTLIDERYFARKNVQSNGESI